MADAPVPVPLDPFEAETLFRAGETLCFVAIPADRFVKTQWHGHEAMAVPIPFDDPETYFAAHPVALWDPAFVNGPRPTPPEQTPTTIRAEVFTGGKIQNTPEPRVPVTLGDVVNVHAVLYDQNGAEMVPIEGMTWESNNTGYLTVEQLDLDDCAATMIRTGNVSCICRYANISGQINFAIAAPPEPLPAATSEVIILPGASNKLAIGGTIEAQTVFRDANGGLVAAPSPVAWSSSDETILTVVADPTDSAKAIVTAVAAGTATISSATTAR